MTPLVPLQAASFTFTSCVTSRCPCHSTQLKIFTYSHRNCKFSLYITMCTFDMFIQFSSRYAHFPTEFTSFHSTPQSMHSFHVLIQLSGRYVRIPTEIANFHFTSQCVLLICLFNSLADMKSFPQNSQINPITQLRRDMHSFPQSSQLPLHPVCNFNFSFKSTPHFTLYKPQEENILKELKNDREYILGYITFRLALLFW